MSADNPAPVPLLDLKAQFASIKDEILPAVEKVFIDQAFIMGPYVAEAEKEFASYLGVKHALGVSSGTDALLLSLMALDIGPGDGVITTPFTFFATVGSIVRLGAVPLMADIDPLTYNLDPEKVAELLERDDLPAKPKAMVPVHLYGQPAQMDALMDLAGKYNLAVVEDGAQALGVVYPGDGGKDMTVGSMGDTGCFSFFPSKNLGGAGDGGLITTGDDDLAVKLRSMRTHGSHPSEKYRHLYVGGNFRLDAVQATVVRTKLPHLEDWSAARRANAADYDRMFAQSGLTGKGLITTPTRVWPGTEKSHVYNQYVIRADNRDGLMAHLHSSGIGNAVYYPIPLHLADCFADLGYKPGDLPAAEKAANEVLAIPVYPELTMEQKERVVGAVEDFYRNQN